MKCPARPGGSLTEGGSDVATGIVIGNLASWYRWGGSDRLIAADGDDRSEQKPVAGHDGQRAKAPGNGGIGKPVHELSTQNGTGGMERGNGPMDSM